MKIKFKSSKLLRLLQAASILGLALGVAALLVVMSVAAGFETRVYDAASKFIAPVVLQRKNFDEFDMQSVKEFCQDCDFIPYSYGQVVLARGKNTMGIRVQNLNFQDPFVKKKMGLKPTQGRWPEVADEILLGSVSAEKMEVKVGDAIQIYMDEFGEFRRLTFRVVGIHTFGYRMVDERNAFSTGLEVESFYHGIKVYPRDQSKVDQLYQLYHSQFSYPWSVRSWKDYANTIVKAIEYEKWVLFIVMACIVLMAVFNITGTIFTMVFERRAEFSIVRSMGFRKKDMIFNLIFSSSKVTATGVFSGVLLGMGMVKILEHIPIIEIPPEIYGFNTLPAVLQWDMIFLIIVFCFVVSLLGAILPAVVMAYRPIAEGLIRG